MKRLIYIFLILLGVTSCMKDDKVNKMESGAKDKVDIVFGVNMPEPTFGTKAMGDTPEVENMYVAVFGGSGFLKEYTKATIVKATENNTRYEYKVSLSLTESLVSIHFIANGPTSIPFRNENEVIASLLKNGNEDAYWQRIMVPGIRAYKDEDGNYLDKDGNIINIDDDGVDPVIDPSIVENYFAEIPLVRNFARIRVETKEGIEHFVLNGFVLINTPVSGTIAPYDRTGGGFVSKYIKRNDDDPDPGLLQSKYYQEFGFEDHDEVKGLRTNNYAGNLPISVEIGNTIPPETESAYTKANKYMYERPVSTSNPTKVIVFGTFDGEKCFYKIDLMDDKGYYPIYRNFEYKITINEVLKKGAATALEAANSAGSGDVSTITEAASLNDVSDGKARIYVQYTEKTIVGQGYVTLKYKFVPDVAHPNTTDNDNVKITRTNNDETPPYGDVVGSEWNASYAADDSEGFRTLRFKTTAPGAGIKTQDIKVTGYYNGGDSKLYRIVSYKLLNKMDLEVVCVPNEVPRTKGEKLDVVIKLPKDLPNSMFPLQLKIEADKLSITPDNDNLPVQPGKSIVTNSNSASYQFVKTLSKAEYDALTSPDEDKVSVPCHFKTSKDVSAGTTDTEQCKVYVDNIDADHEYFNKAFGTFTNFDLRHFDPVRLTPGTDQNVSLYFRMENHSPLPEVRITLTGLVPADPSWTPISGTTTYIYNPGSNQAATIALKTSDDSGVYNVKLEAYHYEDYFLANLSYVNPTFTGSNVPWGINKDVEFKFSYEGTADDPIQEDVVFTLHNLKPADSDTRFEQLRDGRWIFSPTSGSGLDQTIQFKTIKLADDVSVSMSGESYNPAGPINLSCPDLTYNDPKFTIETVPFGSNKDVGFTFGYRGTTTDPIQEDVIFTLTNLKPSEGDNRFTELGGGRWLFKPNANDGLNQTITFKTVKFAADIKVDMSGDYYKSASASKTAPTSFTIAASSLTIVGPNTPDNNTYMYIYSFDGDQSLDNFRFRNGTNRDAISITLNDALKEDERVYIRYGNRPTYYTTRLYTLTELYNASSSVGGFGTTKPTE